MEAEDDAKPVVVNESVPAAEFFTEKASKVSALNDLTRQVFERNPSLGLFVGQGDPRIAMSDSRFDGVLLPSGKVKLNKPLFQKMPDGTSVYIDMYDPSMPLRLEDFSEAAESVAEENLPETIPAHDAMLNPKRKLRISE